MIFRDRKNYSYSQIADNEKLCPLLFELECTPDCGDVFEFDGRRWAVSSISHEGDTAYIKEIPLRDVEPGATEDYEDEITCPYCGSGDTNSFEMGEESDETECGTCSATFSFERYITVSYSTRLVKMPTVTVVPSAAKAVQA